MQRAILAPLLAWALPILAGCAVLPPSHDEILDQRFNGWLGKTKDARIRVAGPADSCVALDSGGEACVWKTVGVDGTSVTRFVTVSSWLHRVVFTYDKAGIAKDWHYSGSWGERSSSAANGPMAEPSGSVLP